MRTLILTLLIAIGGTASAQNILDSVKVYDYPVREGVIYKYEHNTSFVQTCANSLCIVSVVTPSDSVFHFENGKVTGIFKLDDRYTVSIANAKGEQITYSNLEQLNVEKGDVVTRGMLLGTTAQSADVDPSLNQVDILILKKIKPLPYYKTIEYIRSRISTYHPMQRYTVR
jgi:hypothetical protein